MSSIRIRKRGKSYEYCFDIGKVNNKRKRIKMVEGILEQQKLKVEKDKFILAQHLWKL